MASIRGDHMTLPTPSILTPQEGGRAQFSAEARRHLAELGYADG